MKAEKGKNHNKSSKIDQKKDQEVGISSEFVVGKTFKPSKEGFAYVQSGILHRLQKCYIILGSNTLLYFPNNLSALEFIQQSKNFKDASDVVNCIKELARGAISLDSVQFVSSPLSSQYPKRTIALKCKWGEEIFLFEDESTCKSWLSAMKCIGPVLKANNPFASVNVDLGTHLAKQSEKRDTQMVYKSDIRATQKLLSSGTTAIHTMFALEPSTTITLAERVTALPTINLSSSSSHKVIDLPPSSLIGSSSYWKYDSDLDSWSIKVEDCNSKKNPIVLRSLKTGWLKRPETGILSTTYKRLFFIIFNNLSFCTFSSLPSTDSTTAPRKQCQHVFNFKNCTGVSVPSVILNKNHDDYKLSFDLLFYSGVEPYIATSAFEVKSWISAISQPPISVPLLERDMIKQGWLYTSKKSLYCMLYSNGLFQYYSDEKRIHLLNTINLRNCISIWSPSLANKWHTNNKNKISQDCTFDLLESSGKALELCAQSKDDFTSWIKSISSYLSISPPPLLPIVKEGWLLRQVPWIPTAQKRYFILTPTCLYSFLSYAHCVWFRRIAGFDLSLSKNNKDKQELSKTSDLALPYITQVYPLYGVKATTSESALSIGFSRRFGLVLNGACSTGSKISTPGFFVGLFMGSLKLGWTSNNEENKNDKEKGNDSEKIINDWCQAINNCVKDYSNDNDCKE